MVHVFTTESNMKNRRNYTEKQIWTQQNIMHKRYSLKLNKYTDCQ